MTAALSNGLLPSSGAESKIPRQLLFTYKSDILKEKVPPLFYQNVKQTIYHYIRAWGNNDVPVWFMTDDDCRRAINATKPELVFYFDQERDGSFKADICRVAALYWKGGFYFDVDMEVYQAFVPDGNVSFVTVYNQERTHFFQSFLASEPGNRILWKALDVMLNYYRQNKTVPLMGTATLFEAFHAVPPSERGQTHFLHETHLGLGNYPDVPSHRPRKNDKATRWLCNYVVEDEGLKQVFFYSRLAGEGKC